MASPQVQIKIFRRLLWNICRKSKSVSSHFTMVSSFFFRVFINFFFKSLTIIMSGMETQSGSRRLVFNLRTSALRFPCWCHCELHVPDSLGLFPDCRFNGAFLSDSLKCQNRLPDTQSHSQEIKLSACVNSGSVDKPQTRRCHI